MEQQLQMVGGANNEVISEQEFSSVLDRIDPQLFQLVETLSPENYSITHLPGAWNKLVNVSAIVNLSGQRTLAIFQIPNERHIHEDLADFTKVTAKAAYANYQLNNEALPFFVVAGLHLLTGSGMPNLLELRASDESSWVAEESKFVILSSKMPAGLRLFAKIFSNLNGEKTIPCKNGRDITSNFKQIILG